MTKKQIFYLGLFASIITLSSGFRPFQAELFPWFHVFDKEIVYKVPTEIEVGQTYFDVPFTGKTFVGFQQRLAVRESQGKYHKVNTLGYLGKYQFGSETLESLGVNDEQHFLESRKLQEKAFMAYLARNKWELRKEIAKYTGRVIRGITITESGILAAAHLGGPGAVKKFLRSNGQRKFKDGYGTSITEYLREFAGYDTSFIEANKKAKAGQY